MDRVYAHATRFFMVATALLLGATAGCAFPFMNLWMGPGFGSAAVVTILLAATYFVGNLSIVGSTLLRAVGKPQYETYYSVLNAVANIGATLILVRWFGLYGVVGGMLAGTILGQVYFTWILHRVQQMSLRDGLFAWVWKLCAATLAGILVDIFLSHLFPWHPHMNRLHALVQVVTLVSAYVAVFAASIWAMRVIDGDDLARMRLAVRFGLRENTQLQAEPAATQ
jgi:O-antigen/teichoic acid export membrane protein